MYITIYIDLFISLNVIPTRFMEHAYYNLNCCAFLYLLRYHEHTLAYLQGTVRKLLHYYYTCEENLGGFFITFLLRFQN